MNCRQVQKQLSEYFDQSLDSGNMKSVERHLSSCALCRAEAESLLLCIQNVAKLPTVEPPPGFAEQVMSHVRSLEIKPSLWERLWFPLRIKIPLHATAVVLIGVLTVYVFEKEQSRENSLTTSEQVTSRPERKEPTELAPSTSSLSKTEEPATDASAAPPSFNASKSGSASRSGDKKQALRNTPPEIAVPAQAPGGTPHESAEAQSLEERRPDELQPLLPIDPRRRAQGVISGTPVINPAMPRLGARPFSLPSELESQSLTPGSPSLLPLADYELVVRRRLEQQDQVLRGRPGTPRTRSEPAAPEGQATPSSVERLMAMIPDSTRPQTVWVSLAPSQFQQFKKELGLLGTIEVESATSFRDLEFASKTDSEILIKLTILPGPETERRIPDAPSDR
jgi:cytoskeletal protein RodZ